MVLTQDGGAVFNEDSADVDFRVESNGNTHMLFVDGGNDRVGIGTSSPSVPLDILTNLSSDTTSSPDTVLTLSTKYASTGSNGAAGAGPRLEFQIPDDETNPITGAAIAGIKEAADDSDASAGMAFYISQNDTTLDEAMRLASTGQVSIDKSAYIKQVAITSSSNATAWDAAAAANAYYATSENTTFSAPSNATEGAIISVEIAQGGTARTVAWNTVFEFAASTAPTITATANKTDILTFRYNGSVWQEIGRVQNMAQT